MAITYKVCEEYQILGRDTTYVVELADFSEELSTSIFRVERRVSVCHTTGRHTPEECNLHGHRRESHNFILH